MLFRPGVKESKVDFYNFEMELKGVIEALISEIHRMIVIKGVRRTGKSSLLRVSLNESSLPHLLIDLREFCSGDQIYESVELSLRRTLSKLKGLKRYLETVSGITIAGFSVSFHERRMGTISSILKALNEWAGDQDTYFAIAIDEAQGLKVVPGFPRLIAHVYDYLERIKLIMAGSQVGLLDRFLGKGNPESPLFARPFLEVKLDRLSKEKSLDFLRRGFSELGISCREENLEETFSRLNGVIGWLANYGYYATVKGHQKALELTVNEGSTLVASEIENFLSNRRPARRRYISILKLLSTRPMRWSELKRGLYAEVGKVNDKNFTHYIKELISYGFLVKGKEGIYKLADPLISEAIKIIR